MNIGFILILTIGLLVVAGMGVLLVRTVLKQVSEERWNVRIR
ncbi:hypothetical protein [Nonomuraea sp. 3-1Str]|nr:hypothetical protein [Nonomuraea sp. 3-1Str]